MGPRKLNASGWCVRNADCPSPIGCATVSGGSYPACGEVCRACATDAADIALFEQAEQATAFADPESGKPLVEFVANPDQFSRVAGWVQVFDGRGKGVVYRVQESAPDIDACRSFDLVKLREDAGDKEAGMYRCEVTTGGHAVSCECRGYLAHGRCKHTRAVGKLVYAKVL